MVIKKTLILGLVGYLIECLEELVKETDNDLDDKVVDMAKDIHSVVDKVL